MIDGVREAENRSACERKKTEPKCQHSVADLGAERSAARGSALPRSQIADLRLRTTPGWTGPRPVLDLLMAIPQSAPHVVRPIQGGRFIYPVRRQAKIRSAGGMWCNRVGSVPSLARCAPRSRQPIVDGDRVSRPDASSGGGGIRKLSTLQRGLRRMGWGLGDQAVSSLTNLICGVTAAHLLGAEQLGAYSLAFVTYAVALNCSRGLATDPLMVRVAVADEDTRRRAIRQCTGTALLVGVVAGSALVILALLLPPPIQGALLALGAVMPALMLQDSWRFAFFVGGRGSKSLVNDMVWGLALVPALLLVAVTGHRTAFWFILAWGGAASVAALFGLLQARIMPRPDKAWAWLHSHRDLGVRYMVEGMAGSLADQIRAYGIGIAVGLAAVGYLQVVNTLLGPLMILRLGIGTVIVPELAIILRQSPRRMQHACLLLSAALAGTAALWGIVVWIGLPHGLGAVVVGDHWRSAAPLIPLATLGIVAASIIGPAGAGLHALGAARRSMRAMLIGAGLYASMSVGGAIVGGLPGALLGTALAYFIGGGLWWRELRTEIRARQTVVAEEPRRVAAEAPIASARKS